MPSKVPDPNFTSLDHTLNQKPNSAKSLEEENQKKKVYIAAIFIFILVVILIALVVVVVAVIITRQKGITKEPFTVSSSTKGFQTTQKTFTTTSNRVRTPFSYNPNTACPFTLNTTKSDSSCSYGYSDPYCDECGLQFIKPNVKIIGGVEAQTQSWPSIVLIKFNYRFTFLINGGLYDLERSASCGGTLINRNTVVTAAHCFVTKITFTYNNYVKTVSVEPNSYYPTYESMYTVYLGVHNYSDSLNGKALAMSVSKFITYPFYDESNTLYDIAIIKLSNEVDLDCKIQIACLPSPMISNYPVKDNIESWAVGWGTKSNNEKTVSDTLQNVKLTIYNTSYCRNVSPFVAKRWNFQICAGEISGGKDTCLGDSGGPLFIKDIVNGVTKYILVGITSYGDGCGITGLPGIYTKVSSFLSWIQENS